VACYGYQVSRRSWIQAFQSVHKMPVGQLVTGQHTWNVSPLLRRNAPYRTVYSMSKFFITDAPTPSKFAWLADRSSGSRIYLHRQPFCGGHIETSLYGFLHPCCIPWNQRTVSKPEAHLPGSSCEIRRMMSVTSKWRSSRMTDHPIPKFTTSLLPPSSGKKGPRLFCLQTTQLVSP